MLRTRRESRERALSLSYERDIRGIGAVDLLAGLPAPVDAYAGRLVSGVDEHQAEAEELGVEIEELVDAPNTLALFVWGPDRVKLEYIEHKPSFSLT